MLKQFDFEKTPVVEVVNDILVEASKMGASDVHFDPLEQYMKARVRIDGQLRDYAQIPNSIKKNLITRIKIISGMNITESRLPQDGAIKATIKDVNLDLRVSSIPTIEGEKIVIRILDYSMSNSGLETLGFSDVNLKKVIQMINVPNGIILITGATGSGKSTTVYSILQRLNKEETNIITVEDPIEMNIEGINQIQTNSEIGLDFATALRSILRQDPNIIMVGEIRDTETAKIAVRASITGHLVLSTIHTNDSLNTIERLLDMDVERYLLSSALTGIVSQKLARKLCPHCRTKRAVTQYENNIFKKVLGHEVNEIYTSNGCDQCGNGYSGRIAIHEVLLINQTIKDAISENIRKEKLRELVYNSDVITLLQDGLEKVEAGYTTFEELLKIIELEEDEKLAEASSLKQALVDTTITHNDEGLPKTTSSEIILEEAPKDNLENTSVMKPVFRKLEEIVSDQMPFDQVETGIEPQAGTANSTYAQPQVNQVNEMNQVGMANATYAQPSVNQPVNPQMNQTGMANATYATPNTQNPQPADQGSSTGGVGLADLLNNMRKQ